MPGDVGFVIDHFNEEKITNLIVIIIGVLSISFALFFLCIIKYSFFKGMAIPLLVLGLLQLSVGSWVYMQTRSDILKMGQEFTQDYTKMILSEVSRIRTTLEHFQLFQNLEILLVITGAILYIKFYRSSFLFWKGFGLALLIQSTIMFTLDLVAENRTQTYFEILRQYV